MRQCVFTQIARKNVTGRGRTSQRPQATAHIRRDLPVEKTPQQRCSSLRGGQTTGEAEGDVDLYSGEKMAIDILA